MVDVTKIVGEQQRRHLTPDVTAWAYNINIMASLLNSFHACRIHGYIQTQDVFLYIYLLTSATVYVLHSVDKYTP